MRRKRLSPGTMVRFTSEWDELVSDVMVFSTSPEVNLQPGKVRIIIPYRMCTLSTREVFLVVAVNLNDHNNDGWAYIVPVHGWICVNNFKRISQ